MRIKAFSLVEILLVVLILGILVTLGLPALDGWLIKTKLAELFLGVEQIERAIDAYGIEYGWGTAGGIDFGNYDLPESRYFQYRMRLWIDIDPDTGERINYYGIMVWRKDFNPMTDPMICLRVVRANRADRTWAADADPWARYLHFPE